MAKSPAAETVGMELKKGLGLIHVFAIAVTGAVILLSLLLDLRILVEAASTVLIVAGVLACLSVIVLRESRLQNYRPAFRTPLYPWLQIAGIGGLGLVLFEMGVEAYFISAVPVGIAFSDDAPNVQAAFVLAGSRDERNFHLRALAAIAQIVQSPDFRKRWLGARGHQSLRDAVLLGPRQRP